MMTAGAGHAQQTPASAPAATTQAAPAATTQKASSTAKPSTAAKTPAKSATTAKSATPAALTTRTQKFSYALGMSMGAQIGGNLKRQSVDVDWNIVAEGLKDEAAGGKIRLTQEEAQAVLGEVQAEVAKQRQEKMEQAAAANKTEGEAFLAANKSKEGVVALPSGLQYKILTAGTGQKPMATDTVVCNYRGTLINGTEFDSSYKRGQPATFALNQVIKGWTEALQLMPVGSKWQLYIPSNLGYGEQGGPGGAIGPSVTLIFDVELLSIADKSKEEKKEAKPEEKKDSNPEEKKDSKPEEKKDSKPEDKKDSKPEEKKQ